MGISLQQFEQMKGRVAAGTAKRGKNARASGAAAAAAEINPARRPSANISRVILGVDPSLRGTGYGVIRHGGGQPMVALAQGTISCPKDWEHSRCLVKISEVLRDLISAHQPVVCAIEGLFFAQNLKTALIMGEARGAAIAAIAGGGLEIYEMAPRKVKQAIVGYGAAQKLAVAKMVQRMLALEALPAPDAADALALAIAHAQEAGRYALTSPKRV